jgi:hypothetical protein
MALRPEECNKVSRPLFACIVFGVESLAAEKLLLCYAPFLGEMAYLVPAQLCGRIWCVWCVRVVGPEPFLNALYDGGASKVSCSGRVFEAFRELGDELVSPICSRVTEVQIY